MPDNDDMKTKWPPNMGPKRQVQRVLTALLEKIGIENVRGLAVFVRYDGKNSEGESGVQNAIFTGGHEVDDVYDWARKTISDE